MNWDAVGAIGEILGAIAVFGSLLYLAVQIKAQNKESRLSAIIEFTDLYNQVTDSVSSDAEMSRIWVRAATGGLNELDEAETVRYVALLQKITRMWENSYYQHKDGRLDTRLWNSFNTQISEVSTLPAYKTFWGRRSHYFSEEFREFVKSNDADDYQLLSENRDGDT